MTKKNVSNEMTNIYQKIPKHLLPKSHNPNYKNHLMNVPFRTLIVGSSGSGKTTLVFEMLKRMNKTFNQLIICCKSIEEPLYQYLLSKKSIKKYTTFYENGDVPSIDEIETGSDINTLIVFDDLVNMKNQDEVIEYFLRARKKNISCVYLTQSYFRTPKTIRLNCNYIFLKKMSSTNDLIEILKDNNLGVNNKELLKIYKDATNEKLNFLMVDIDAEAEKRFRCNFLNIYDVSKFKEPDKIEGPKRTTKHSIMHGKYKD